MENIPIDQINVDGSLRLNARLHGDALDDDVVLQYWEDMERTGADFPPIVLSGTAKTRFLVRDGNHRLAAFLLSKYAKKKNATIGAYVLKTDDEFILSVVTQGAINRRNGLQVNTKEGLDQACYLSETYPNSATVEEIAELLGIKFATLKTELTSRKIKAKLHHLPVDDIHKTTLLALNAIKFDEQAMRQLAAFVIDHELTRERVQDCISEMKTKCRSDKSRADYLDKVGEALRAAPIVLGGQKNTGKTTTKRPAARLKQQYMSLVDRLIAFLNKNSTHEHFQITGKSEKETGKSTAYSLIQQIKKAWK